MRVPCLGVAAVAVVADTRRWSTEAFFVPMWRRPSAFAEATAGGPNLGEGWSGLPDTADLKVRTTRKRKTRYRVGKSGFVSARMSRMAVRFAAVIVTRDRASGDVSTSTTRRYTACFTAAGSASNASE